MDDLRILFRGEAVVGRPGRVGQAVGPDEGQRLGRPRAGRRPIAGRPLGGRQRRVEEGVVAQADEAAAGLIGAEPVGRPAQAAADGVGELGREGRLRPSPVAGFGVQVGRLVPRPVVGGAAAARQEVADLGAGGRDARPSRVGGDAGGRGQAQRRQQADGEERRRRRPPPNPLGPALPRAGRPGQDWLVGDEPPQVLRQRRGGRIPAAGRLLQTFQANRFQIARHLRPQLARRDGLLRRDLDDHVKLRLALERGPAGQALVQDLPHRVHVRSRAEQLGAGGGLLRGHVGGRAGAAAGRVAVQLAGQAEVGDLGRAVGRQQHVGRLQVAVDDACQVSGVDGAGQHLDKAGGVVGGWRGGRQAVA
jgi:hypothetical protein